MKKISLGDVFEFETKLGKVYLHYVSKDEDIELVRVLDGFHDALPLDMDMLVRRPEKFLIHFPIAAALRKGIVNKAGHSFEMLGNPPLFMRSVEIIGDEFLGWQIVNTSNLQRRLVKELSEEEKRLSPFGVWNDTLLREQLETGWDLEQWSKDPYSL
jgi:hypothetical protein